MKRHITNFLAAGVGMATMAGNAEAAIHNIVFDVQPKAINLQVCKTDQLSLNNIQQMINQRNYRDIQIIRSSVDDMLHL